MSLTQSEESPKEQKIGFTQSLSQRFALPLAQEVPVQKQIFRPLPPQCTLSESLKLAINKSLERRLGHAWKPVDKRVPTS